MYRPANTIIKVTILLVAVCLVGSAFHIHQFFSDHRPAPLSIQHQVEKDHADCIACLHLLQGVASKPIRADRIEFRAKQKVASPLDVYPEDIISDLNNKSPPFG